MTGHLVSFQSAPNMHHCSLVVIILARWTDSHFRGYSRSRSPQSVSWFGMVHREATTSGTDLAKHLGEREYGPAIAQFPC